MPTSDREFLLIPDYCPIDPKPYPGDIKPGYYTRDQAAGLLRKLSDNPQAIHFLADMLEEVAPPEALSTPDCWPEHPDIYCFECNVYRTETNDTENGRCPCCGETGQ